MDVDPQEKRTDAAAGAPRSTGGDVSSAIPSSASAGSASASHAGGAAEGAHAGNATSSNAMQTDTPTSKGAAGGSTDAKPSSASGASRNATTASGKTYYGAFSRYTASHPTSNLVSASGSAQNRDKSSFSKNDVIPSSSFNLRALVAPYSGPTVIDRLIYAAERSSALAIQAYQSALDELKTTENTNTYRLLTERLSGPQYSKLTFDLHWLETKNAQSSQQFERLELELSSYKANLIKDNVRIASRGLGDFHFNRGDYGAALRAYSRMRDYCSTPAHHTDMNVCQARACLQLQSFSQLLTHVARAEQTPDLDVTLANQLKCWSALAYMADRKYKVAARRFLEVRIDKLPDTITQTISVNDIAKYATLMALAEFDRADLNKSVLTNPDFGLFLEKEPIMLELAKSFYESQYGKCMSILNQIVPDLRFDIRIGDHIESLAKSIRSRALIQYITPFSSVDMVEMAKAFDMSIQNLEKDLAELIVHGSISARIDSHNKRLFATESDQRAATFAKSYDAADSFRSQTMAMLLRVNLIRHGFVVKGSKAPGLGPSLNSRGLPPSPWGP